MRKSFRGPLATERATGTLEKSVSTALGRVFRTHRGASGLPGGGLRKVPGRIWGARGVLLACPVASRERPGSSRARLIAVLSSHVLSVQEKPCFSSFLGAAEHDFGTIYRCFGGRWALLLLATLLLA